MGLIAKNKGGVDFAPCPPGSHVARCVWLIDLGTQATQKFGKKHKILIGWELPDEQIPDGDRAGEPYFVSRRYTSSLNERAALRKDLESWRKKAFTDEELEGFDLRNILDRPCLLTVTHNTNGQKVYANVSSVAPLAKGMKCSERINPLRQFDLDKPDWDVYRALPEWLQKLIDGAEERKQAPGSEGADEPPPYTDADIPAEEEDEVPF